MPTRYLDNAATSFPKPSEVLSRMLAEYQRAGVSPGRGGYDLAVAMGHRVQAVRARLARFFRVADPWQVVFAANATDAMNLLLLGTLGPGDRVITTRLEHNAVLRPLHHLERTRGVHCDMVPFDSRGMVDPGEIARRIGPGTRLVVMTHASNVLGTLQPIAEIGAVCREKGVPLCLDAAQSAGQVDIDMAGWGVAALAFTGHKALFGPSGIGGLVLDGTLEVAATRFGGTGTESHRLTQPDDLPERLEAGTLNVMGILGLDAGLDFIAATGLETIHRHETALADRLRAGAAAIPGVRLLAGAAPAPLTAVVSVTIDGLDPGDAADILDGDYDIAVRAGLHCAPLVHADLGTAPRGAVRFSIGWFNTAADIDAALEALAAIAGPRARV